MTGAMFGRAFLYAGLLAAVQLVAGCSDDGRTDAPASPETETVVPAGKTAAPADERGEGKLVLAFGDSLYAGYGLGQNESFPSTLEAALKEMGIAARVHNAGVSGDTSAAGLQRLNFTLEGLPRKPDLVLVGLGGNDMLRGIDPGTTRANLDAVLAELRRRDIKVMLTGLLAAPNMGADYGRRFNAIYPELARKYDAKLDPFFLDGVITDRGLMLPDGLHPNAKGIDAIVARVAPEVAGALKS